MNKIWTILDLINWATGYFKEKEIDSPRLTAELLLSHTLKINRIQLYTNYSKPLNQEELKTFKNLIKRRIAGEPTQYIIEKKEFWSLEFYVNKNVLIPRVETEFLVERVYEFLKNKKEAKNILEIGTGSGNVVISLAKEFPDKNFYSVDISYEALKVAKYNSLNHDCNNVFLLAGDLFKPIKKNKLFDCIISNPPYIKTSEMNKLSIEVKEFEPEIALNGGEDGMFFYYSILSDIDTYMTNKGAVFFEIGDYNQGKKIVDFLQEKKTCNASILNDYSDNPRVVEIFF